MTIGVDLGDRTSHFCRLDRMTGEVLEGTLPSSRRGFEACFSGIERARVVIEAGGHSPWVSRLLTELGQEVVVANPNKIALITQSQRKCDRVDAHMLARLGSSDPRLLSPIRHRSAETQATLTRLRARDVLIRARTSMINMCRGSCKAMGARLPSMSAEAFSQKAPPWIPKELMPALAPLLDGIGDLTRRCRAIDRELEEIFEKEHADAHCIREIRGVGSLTALAYVLTLEDPKRFAKSRDVGAYVGLCPRVSQSGGRDPELSITKAGDRFLRRLLVSSAQYILGPFGEDCTLRRCGERILSRGGKNAKKRAVVAVARRLAVLMHHLWATQGTYDPMYGLPKKA